MAISPNTDFTSGQILTATQQNQFPRGIMAYAQSTTTDTVTVEEIELTASTFTAVANRYYKISYFEPKISSNGNGSQFTQRIRLTNLAGTVLQTSFFQPNTANFLFCVCETVVTLSAGSTVIVGTAQMGDTTANLTRSATEKAFIVVQDIGPA
jgi:hypothetical protein